MKWFTSDLHINHRNICRGISKWDDENSTRDFRHLAEMNDAIFSSINKNVKENDTLYILGDFAFGDKSLIPEHRKKINCQDVRLVYGNHDQAIQRNREFRNCFTWCRHYHETKIHDISGQKQYLVLFHYYIGGVWNNVGRGCAHLFGHSHGSLDKKHIVGKAFDIGWDVWRKPLNEWEVCDHLKTLNSHVNWLDHHTEKTNYA